MQLKSLAEPLEILIRCDSLATFWIEAPLLICCRCVLFLRHFPSFDSVSQIPSALLPLIYAAYIHATTEIPASLITETPTLHEFL